MSTGVIGYFMYSLVKLMTEVKGEVDPKQLAYIEKKQLSGKYICINLIFVEMITECSLFGY